MNNLYCGNNIEILRKSVGVRDDADYGDHRRLAPRGAWLDDGE